MAFDTICGTRSVKAPGVARAALPCLLAFQLFDGQGTLLLFQLIGQLEAEDISLEEAFTAYSKGMNLLKQCSEQIDRVEKQVMKLNEEGGLEPLDPQ